MPGAIANTLGLPERAGISALDEVVKYLHGKHAMLILDNFEHVMPAASVISTVVSQALHVRVLVTSREVLRLSGEQEYPVPPLAIPEKSRPGLDYLPDVEAVTLFMHRAQSTNPSFALTHDNMNAIADICQRVDGIPLAIELAAARIRHLTPKMILARLDTGLEILSQGPRDAPARQRTLRATIDWSYQLLNASEKVLFSRLGIFGGGWSLDAMEAICTEDLPDDVFNLLASLIDKNLIQQIENHADEPRFTMLQTVREFALDHLGEDDRTHLYARHYEWFLSYVQTALSSGNRLSATWFQRLRLDEDNLEIALSWAEQEAKDTPKLARMAVALTDYWHMRGSLRTGRYWIECGLAELDEDPSPDRARTLNAAGAFAHWRADYEAVEMYCGEALSIFRGLGGPQRIGNRLTLFGPCCAVPR